MGRVDLASLVRICDQTGRPRGTGFVADDLGTVVTGHETVDGLDRVLVETPETGTATESETIIRLPAQALALIHTEGLAVRPLPIAAHAPLPGTYVRIHAHGWREARVLGTAEATYTATERFHTVDGVLELAIGTDGSEALRRDGEAAGGPVLDATTGIVLAVLGTALHTDHRAPALAVPLAPTATRAPEGPLAALLRRNTTTAPAHGPDLNLAGALELTTTTLPPPPAPTFVPRARVARELDRFVTKTGTGVAAADLAVTGDPAAEAGPDAELLASGDGAGAAGPMPGGGGPAVASVCAVVGGAGTGRSGELAGLAARRGCGGVRAPTVWVRGADLREDDTSVGDAVLRALRQAGRIVAASRGDWSAYPGQRDAGDTLAARVARVAQEAGRPLAVLLDGADEMPQALARRLPEWTAGTLDWLRAHGARLALTCRPEHWETAGALFPAGALHRPDAPARLLPDAVPIGALTAAEAARVRERYGLTEAAVAPEDARHPLALRLLGEVRAALPDALPERPGRAEIFAAYTDLACLRAAARMADGAEGGAVRELAARVAGRLHQAARHCLTTGSAALDRETFEELFPWAAGWAAAVLAEGLLEPAGPGYRFGHEELGEWIQGQHVDVDALLDALVDRPAPESPPRHRLGVVLQALLHQETAEGPAALARRLGRLVDPATTRDGDVGWWAARLLRGVLLRVRDARPYGGVLRPLAGRIAVHPEAAREFGAWFWERLRVGEDERMELLRRLLPADGAEGAGGFLEAVALRLGADPRGVQPLLCRWLGDGRTLHAGEGAHVPPTVGGVAQALLHTHRDLAVDDLCEALVSTAHPRARELLTRLVDDEPAALCRAVDRWAHDDARPDRRVAAAAYGRLLAARVTAEADREPLRYAALALLARPGDAALHGTALSLLLRDPRARADHLPRALAEFRDGGPGAVPAGVLAPALATHPEEVLAAFGARLRDDRGAAEVLDALAAVRSPALARRAAALVRAYAARHPAGAPYVAAYAVQRLAQGTAARAVLFPLVADLMRGGADEVRDALARVLTAPEPGRGLRAELLDVLLDRQHPDSGDLALAEALLGAAALGAAGRPEERTRELVLRAGLLLLRTAKGAPRFDRRLTGLARDVPGFAVLLSGWTAREPRRWAALVGQDARRTIERLAAPGPVPGEPRALPPVPVPALTAMPMQGERRGHGTLRPA